MKTTLMICLLFYVRWLRGTGFSSTGKTQIPAGAGLRPFPCLQKKIPFSWFVSGLCHSEESITELNYINASLEKWQSLTPFRFLAVSVDEGKTAGRMRPTYNMNGWTFESYTDLYGDLRRALHSNNLPQSMIIYKNAVIYEQSGWTAGSEDYLIQRLVSVKN